MFNRRLIVSFLIIFALFAIVFVRLVRLQALDYQGYRDRVGQLMVRPPILLPSIRGQILDRNGKILADNVACFDIGIHYRALSLNDKYIERLARKRALADLGRRPDKTQLAEYRQRVKHEIQHTFQELPALTGESAVVINERCQETIDRITQIRRRTKDRLLRRRQQLDESWLQDAQAQAISRQITSLVLREELSYTPVVFGLENDKARTVQTALGSPEWLTLIPTTKRVYPYEHVAAQTIGSLGLVQADDVLYQQHSVRGSGDRPGDPFRGYAPEGDTMGRDGVEAGYEWQVLRGTRGLRQQDRHGDPVPGGDIRPKPGDDLHLTIDIELQREMEAAMVEYQHELELPDDAEFAGAAVAIDIKTGHVLALVSIPLLLREHPELPEVETPNQPLGRMDGPTPWMNRAVEARYPPGSTVKPVVILAALSQIDGTTNRPLISFDRADYCLPDLETSPSCSHIHGLVDGPKDAIKRSCNVYCAGVGELLGESMLAWFPDFGLARHTPLNLPRENDGTLPGTPPNRYGMIGRLPAYEARQIAIGQGKLTATPLQVANMMATLARRGIYKPPRLALEQQTLPDAVQLPCDSRAVDLVLDAMKAVVHEPGGTAFSVRELHDLGFTVAGKTGTAEYSQGLEDWRCWFAGFAPADNPQIAFAVVIEHGESGGKVAGPIAGRFLELCAVHGYVKPSAPASH